MKNILKCISKSGKKQDQLRFLTESKNLLLYTNIPGSKTLDPWLNTDFDRPNIEQSDALLHKTNLS